MLEWVKVYIAPDPVPRICRCGIWRGKKEVFSEKGKKELLAALGFDPRTSGL